MAFEIARQDNRSSSQVLLDYVSGGEPGHIYTYEELATVLGQGGYREFNREDVRQVVYQAQNRFLEEFRRTLQCVRGVGYKIALAEDHQSLARDYDRKAYRAMRRGLKRLSNVVWDELSPAARAAHEGQLMVSVSICAAVKQLRRRMDRHDQALDDLRRQVSEIKETAHQ